MLQFSKSIFVFLLAGLFEIGGGFLIWLWLKEEKPFWYAIAGGTILTLYAIIATLQEASFARTYVAYGGFFIVLSLIWAWKFDHFLPDKYDIIGACIALLGVCIIFFSRRG